MDPTLCESCWHYDYDEEYDEYYCMMDLDEDEVYRIFSTNVMWQIIKLKRDSL